MCGRLTGPIGLSQPRLSAVDGHILPRAARRRILAARNRWIRAAA
jgi:hypothetical protein